LVGAQKHLACWCMGVRNNLVGRDAVGQRRSPSRPHNILHCHRNKRRCRRAAKGQNLDRIAQLTPRHWPKIMTASVNSDSYLGTWLFITKIATRAKKGGRCGRYCQVTSRVEVYCHKERKGKSRQTKGASPLDCDCKPQIQTIIYSRV